MSLNQRPKSIDVVEAALRISQLRLVNDQAGVGFAIRHGVENFVERCIDGFKIGLHQAQRQIGGGQPARNRDALPFDFLEPMGCKETTIGP